MPGKRTGEVYTLLSRGERLPGIIRPLLEESQVRGITSVITQLAKSTHGFRHQSNIYDLIKGSLHVIITVNGKRSAASKKNRDGLRPFYKDH